VDHPKDTTPENATNSLVIMAAHANSVRGTIAFLSRRGVNAKFVTNINEAIEIFAKKEATILLLSMNVPHPKVDLLPTLMQQSFQVTTIVFAEQADRKTAQRLANAKTKHVIYGPVSGPVILMKMRQIEKELAGEEAMSEETTNGERVSADRDSGSGGIKVGGGNGGDGDNAIVLKGSKGGSVQEQIASAMSALGDDPNASGSRVNSSSGEANDREAGSLQRSGGVIVQKGSAGELMKANQDGEKSSQGLSSAAAQALRKGLMARQEAEASKANEATNGSLGDGADSTGAQSGSAAKSGKMNGRSGGRGEKPAGSASDGNNSPSAAATRTAKRDSSPKIHDALPGPEKNQRELNLRPAKLEANSATSASFSSNDIVMRECMQKALLEVCGPYSIEPKELHDCKFASLVLIDSLSLKGSVLMAVGHSLKPGSELVEKVKRVFLGFLKVRGFVVAELDCASVDLDHLKLVESTVCRSTHAVFRSAEGIEMAALIIPNLHRLADVEVNEEDKMAMIHLKDLTAEVPLNFEVYLHMPVNKKYIRYLKSGAQLGDSQAVRLERSQVTHLFLNENDREACRKYFAINTIISKSA
jgi:hypothetical protein